MKTAAANQARSSPSTVRPFLNRSLKVKSSGTKKELTPARPKKKWPVRDGSSSTLFLDEIGNLQPSSQIKLLRAIQEKKIKYIGGKELIDVDVRIIAATNLDLQEAMQKCGFRESSFIGSTNLIFIFHHCGKEKRTSFSWLTFSWNALPARMVFPVRS